MLFQTNIFSEGIWVRKRCGSDCFLVVIVSCLELNVDHSSALTAGAINTCVVAINSDDCLKQEFWEGEECLFSSKCSMKHTAWTTFLKYMVKVASESLCPYWWEDQSFCLPSCESRRKNIYSTFVFTGNWMLKLSSLKNHPKAGLRILLFMSIKFTTFMWIALL